MNTSKLIKQIYIYLGYHSVQKNEDTDIAVEKCLDELKGLAHFNYRYKYFKSPPEFLMKEPYISYLRGSSGVILSVMTLGGEVDAKIKYYARTDSAKSPILDASASAYLEYLSDGYERTIGDNLSYRFCPGYGGSDIGDLRYIFDILKPEKIGITLSAENYMLPSKSMAGIIAVGGANGKTCDNCVAGQNCEYKKRGTVCYGTESE